MKILDGKKTAEIIKEELRDKIKMLGKPPRLAVVQVGDDPASSAYIKNKEKACEFCGINFILYKFEDNVSEETLLSLIDKLNIDRSVDGILVQLPLPNHIRSDAIIQSIDPAKDVDGLNEINAGKFYTGKSSLSPCTAKGIVEILKRNDIDIEGKHCVVVGRSNVVGKPAAIELLNQNATVTICHSKTKNLQDVCKSADILICAIGRPKFFTKEYVSSKTVVVDVGIHRLDGQLCGDVDFEDVSENVAAITPVPGGIGPMTVAMLVKNCFKAAVSRLVGSGSAMIPKA